jgi:hypothetical protein
MSGRIVPKLSLPDRPGARRSLPGRPGARRDLPGRPGARSSLPGRPGARSLPCKPRVSVIGRSGHTAQCALLRTGVKSERRQRAEFCLLNWPLVHVLCLLKPMLILRAALPAPLYIHALPSSPPILMSSKSPQTFLGPEMFGPLSPSFLDQPPFGPGGSSAGHTSQPAGKLGAWPAEGSEMATAGLQFMPDITCVLCSSPIRTMLIPRSAISLPYSTTRSRTHICTRWFRRQRAARPT